MVHIFKDSEELGLHERMALVSGKATQKKFTFYGIASEKSEPQKLKDERAASYPKLDGEERIPMNKVCKNPMLKTPNVRDQKLYGALPFFKIAIDQLVPKPAAVFAASVAGAGSSAEQIMNAAKQEGGDGKLFDIVSKQLFGSVISETSHQFESLDNIVKNIGGIIGGDANTIISMVTDDELTKLMQGLSTGLGNIQKFADSNNAYENIQNVFDKSVFSDGITMANEVQEYIKKYS